MGDWEGVSWLVWVVFECDFSNFIVLVFKFLIECGGNEKIEGIEFGLVLICIF